MKTKLDLLPQTKFANIFAMQRYVGFKKKTPILGAPPQALPNLFEKSLDQKLYYFGESVHFKRREQAPALQIRLLIVPFCHFRGKKYHNS